MHSIIVNNIHPDCKVGLLVTLFCDFGSVFNPRIIHKKNRNGYYYGFVDMKDECIEEALSFYRNKIVESHGVTLNIKKAIINKLIININIL